MSESKKYYCIHYNHEVWLTTAEEVTISDPVDGKITVELNPDSGIGQSLGKRIIINVEDLTTEILK